MVRLALSMAFMVIAALACGRGESASLDAGRGDASTAGVGAESGVAAASGVDASGAKGGASEGAERDPHASDDGRIGEEPSAAQVRARYEAAASGDESELLRLLGSEGPDGLIEEARRTPAHRKVVLLALAHSATLRAIPFLAEVGRGDNEEAQLALAAVHAIAAEPRRAVDPEDGAELREGCDALLALAKSDAVPRRGRIVAVGALRMLSAWGCVKLADIPTEFDAR
jgi:hypothetical protein